MTREKLTRMVVTTQANLATAFLGVRRCLTALDSFVFHREGKSRPSASPAIEGMEGGNALPHSKGPSRSKNVALGCVLAVQVLCAVSIGSAAETAPKIDAVSVGIEGRFKAGYWTPVRIQLVGGSQAFRGSIEIVVPDGDGVPTRFVNKDLPVVELAAGESRTLVRLVKIGRTSGNISIALNSDGTTVARRELVGSELSRPLLSERELIVTYGPSIGLADAIGRKSRAGMNVEICELASPEQFPEHWLGLEAVDTIVLTTSDRSQLDAFSAKQIAALREWVVYGGRLVWCVGKNGAELFGENGRFAVLAPGKFREVSALRNLSTLEAFAGSLQRLEPPANSDSGIPLTVLTDVDGKIELADVAAGISRPLIVRAPFGFGQIIFAAIDLDLPPVSNWEGKGRIVIRLMQESSDEREGRAESKTSTRTARFGYQDMVGQLRSGLDQFPEVTFVSFSWVAGLVLLYIIVIVPVDYFFLRDVVRRMTLTWLTFPVITLAFVGLAIVLGSRWKGNEILVNHVELIDVDLRSGHLRGTTWAHVYSPKAATYDMKSELNPQIKDVSTIRGNVLAWQGLPGSGLGGLSTTAAAPPAIDEYQLELATAERASSEKATSTDNQFLFGTMREVPIHIAATKSLLDRWWGETRMKDSSSLSLDVEGLLRGTVVNPLPIELNDCVVYFDNWAYRLDTKRGTLGPGESTRIENERALNLQWRLTGRRVIETKDYGTPWDQYTLDVPKTVEMMMFHSAAGGESYTQLVNRYQSYIDLTSHLNIGRAILIGRSDSAAMNLVLNDSARKMDRQWTYYRILLPVIDPRRN